MKYIIVLLFLLLISCGGSNEIKTASVTLYNCNGSEIITYDDEIQKVMVHDRRPCLEIFLTNGDEIEFCGTYKFHGKK